MGYFITELWGLWSMDKIVILKICDCYGSFSIGMRDTEPRHQIRNRILLYRVKRLGVNGQKGHFQKFMIHMAFF